MKNNKQELTKHIESLGVVLGYYDNAIDILTVKAVNELKDEIMDLSYRDVVLTIRKKKYVVEVAVVDDEMDLMLYTQKEYLDKYSDEYSYIFE